MAEIKAVFSADISRLEKAFHEVKEKAQEVGKQLGEVGTDLGKGLTGLDIGKLLGIGGAVYAATKLGDALIDAAKEGYKAFQQYQDAVLKFKYNAPASAGTLEERGKLGAEMAETAESKMGIFSFTQLMNAGVALEQVAGELKLSPEKINDLVDTMQALAIKTGTTPDAITENFRKLVVSIKEEGSAAVGKFFKATPGLEEEAGKLRSSRADQYYKDQNVTAETATTGQAEHFAEIIATPIAEFMTKESGRIGAKASLEEVMGMMEAASPKSIIKEEQDIHPEAALNAEIERLMKAFGEDLAPAIREITKTITGAMPTLRDDFAEVADVLKTAVIPSFALLGNYLQAIGGRMNFFGEMVGGILTKLFPFSGKTEISESVNAQLGKMGLDENSPMLRGDYKQTPEQSAKGYHPYGDEHAALEKTRIEAAGALDQGEGADAVVGAQRKAAAKGEEEAAKLNLKTASDHAASQRQIAFEATQSAFEERTRGLAQAALSGARPGDRQSALDAESAEKIINIQAAAAAKERALNEESEVKIAKIEEEIAARKVTRAKEEEGDKLAPAAEAARDALRAAQDAASQTAIDDLHAEAAQKIRDANQSASDKIINEQATSAKAIIDAKLAAALKIIDAEKPPEEDKGPEANNPDTYNTYDKQGNVHEGSYERKIREKKNKEARDEFEATQKQKRKLAELNAAAEKAAADKAATEAAYKASPEGQAAAYAKRIGAPVSTISGAMTPEEARRLMDSPSASPLHGAPQASLSQPSLPSLAQNASSEKLLPSLQEIVEHLQSLVGGNDELIKVFTT